MEVSKTRVWLKDNIPDSAHALSEVCHLLALEFSTEGDIMPQTKV